MFAITLVAVMFARALQNMTNLVLAVQKQKLGIVGVCSGSADKLVDFKDLAVHL